MSESESECECEGETVTETEYVCEEIVSETAVWACVCEDERAQCEAIAQSVEQ